MIGDGFVIVECDVAHRVWTFLQTRRPSWHRLVT